MYIPTSEMPKDYAFVTAYGRQNMPTAFLIIIDGEEQPAPVSVLFSSDEEGNFPIGYQISYQENPFKPFEFVTNDMVVVFLVLFYMKGYRDRLPAELRNIDLEMIASIRTATRSF